MSELVSPGVQVSIIDESFYASAGGGTVPLVIIATAQDKASPDGIGIAPFTTAAEAGQVKLITSQRDLITNYGNPIFKTLGGTALHGHELNEYGLLAAYSYLGAANRAFILRADVDLDQLEPNLSEPVAAPQEGTYWMDPGVLRAGVRVWNDTTSEWALVDGVLFPQDDQLTSTGAPRESFGRAGDFAIVVGAFDGAVFPVAKLWSKQSGQWRVVGSQAWRSETNWDFQVARHTALPSTRSDGDPLENNDVLWQMNTPNMGSRFTIFKFSSGEWIGSIPEGFSFSFQVNDFYNQRGGLTAGDLWAKFNPELGEVEFFQFNGDSTLNFQTDDIDAETILDSIHGSDPAFEIVIGDADQINGASGIISVTLEQHTSSGDFITAEDVVISINNALDSANAGLTFANQLDVVLEGERIQFTSRNGADVKFTDTGDVSGFSLDQIGLGSQNVQTFSNWEALDFVVSADAPQGELADGTLWYDNRVNANNIDLLINNAGTWETFAGNLFVSASEPVSPVAGDVWVSSADLENYPQMFRYTTTGQWRQLDTTDQQSADGVLFADFRANADAALDADAPQVSLYPFNMIAWNKRASGGNVKQWNATEQRWEDYSGNRGNGSPFMLRKAQRQAVVRQLQAAVVSNEEIRNETNRFNLIATPGYPELLDEMIELNTDRKETAFVVGDTPIRLPASGSALQAWATNANNATTNGEDGLLSSSSYAGIYYPSGFTSNLDGTDVAVPASHIVLRTIAFNDQVAFPWFAPAGFQRGAVTNAVGVGYVDAQTGEFINVALNEGQRDTLYLNRVNPIGNFPGRGLAVFGQKTLSPTASALDRVNVARLVAFIRERLDDIVRPFLFEPNDEITRQNAKVLVDRFLGNILSQRGLFDFVVVCDTSNNTPARIDRNELHIDIAIQPLKAVEFIYIPVRIQNTMAGSA